MDTDTSNFEQSLFACDTLNLVKIIFFIALYQSHNENNGNETKKRLTFCFSNLIEMSKRMKIKIVLCNPNQNKINKMYYLII